LRGADVEGDAEHGLRDRVVQFARQPVALCHCSSLFSPDHGRLGYTSRDAGGVGGTRERGVQQLSLVVEPQANVDGAPVALEAEARVGASVSRQRSAGVAGAIRDPQRLKLPFQPSFLPTSNTQPIWHNSHL
jgi:hypothetical protein